MFRDFLIWLNTSQYRRSGGYAQLPDGEAIYCVIETPQFKRGKPVWFKQHGWFYKKPMAFVTETWYGHGVNFQRLDHFRESLIKVIATEGLSDRITKKLWMNHGISQLDQR